MKSIRNMKRCIAMLLVIGSILCLGSVKAEAAGTGGEGIIKITFGKTYECELYYKSYSDYKDRQDYQFTLSKAGIVSFIGSVDTSDVSPSLTLNDSEGSYISSWYPSESSSDLTLDWSVGLLPGTYRICVSAFCSEGTTTNLSFVPIVEYAEETFPETASETDNQMADANLIQVGQNIKGFLCANDREDWYKFCVLEDNIRLTIDRESENQYSVSWSLIDQDGNRVYSDTLNKGEYYLKVSFYGSKEVYSFSLSMTTIGWHKDDKGYWYMPEYGDPPRSRFLYLQETEGKYISYFFDEDGYRVTGWKNLYYDENTYNYIISKNRTNKTSTYYFDQNGVALQGFQKIDGKTYYLNPMHIGWLLLDDKTYYFDQDGVMVTGTMDLDGYRYTFTSDGVMVSKNKINSGDDDPQPPKKLTGWQKISGKWYYYNSNGKAVTGWKEIGHKWYYFASNGMMQTGWKQISKKWYFFDTSTGVMSVGWKKTGGKWYYFNSNGVMQTGWKQLGKKWYFFDSSAGSMSTGWKKIRGKWYFFNSSGEMQTGWKKSGSNWYYLNSSGIMQTGWKQFGSKWYYFGADGCMQTLWKQIGAKWYYFGTDGVWDSITSKYGTIFAGNIDLRNCCIGYDNEYGLYFYGTYNGLYPEDGTDFLNIESDGYIRGDFIGTDRTGCKYAGRFTSAKMVGGSFTSAYEYDLWISVVLSEYWTDYNTGAVYQYGSEMITADDHPVLKKGKKYYFHLVNETFEWGGGMTVYELLDENKQKTGYENGAGQR